MTEELALPGIQRPNRFHIFVRKFKINDVNRWLMISIEKALQIVDKQKVKLTKTEVSLSNSLGFHLAEKIVSPFDLPSFNNSAMDGFAVCGISDSYEITGEVPAGITRQYSLDKREAMHIFTGGKVPDNTTAVIMQEKPM